MEKGFRDYRDYTKYIICKTDISHLNVHESYHDLNFELTGGSIVTFSHEV